MKPENRARRRFLQSSAALGMLEALRRVSPAYARGTGNELPGELSVGGDKVGELVIARTPFEIGANRGRAVTINGTVPGPLLRFREGETATLRVTNRLEEVTSIHWHGVLVPSDQDGVPGISFPGIAPGETFTYRFRLRQNGTYWYHSHSALQEQQGHYAPLVIEPAGRDPVAYDREHIVLLSDWTFQNPHRVLSKLKKQNDVFNFQQLTVGDYLRDVRRQGFGATVAERLPWSRMRMSQTDILDVTAAAYTYLINGLPPDGNWTGLFRAGERVRLRFINAAASTYFNVRIPGLPLTIVQADGQNVAPVTVDEFQIAVAETYDVIVQPQAEEAYTVFAESMDRSGYACGTLAPRMGMQAAVPVLRERPLRSMIDMGMDMSSMEMPGMEHGGQDMQSMPGMEHDQNQTNSMPPMEHDSGANSAAAMPNMDDKSKMDHGQMASMSGMENAGPINGHHGPDTHGPGNSTVAKVQRNRLGEPGTGLADVGHRVLVYNELRALKPARDARPHEREIELHLTGNMEAFMWGLDGKKFSEAPQPFRVQVGERLRITLVNDTMMEHPMHLHGVFMELDNGGGARKPRKHTINVKPAERLSFDLTYDEPGNFAFHCHFLFHMEMGMFRFLNVSASS